MKDEQKMSVSGYAKYLGVAKGSVQKAIATKKIVAGYDLQGKKIIVAIADKEYGNTVKTPHEKPGVSKQAVAKKLAKTATKAATTTVAKEEPATGEKELEDLAKEAGLSPDDITITAEMSYEQLLKTNELINVLLNKNKLLEQAGVLVRKTDVETALYAMGYQLRKSLQAIPSRSIDLLLAAPNKVDAVNLLLKEINDTLAIYGKMDTVELPTE